MLTRIVINGLPAVAMLDTGSMPDAISPEFARVANIKVAELTEAVRIQLGCRGSRSQITFGANCSVEYQSVKQTHYFDVVNLDSYDAIIGVGFMRRFGLVLDPAKNTVSIAGKSFPILSEGEELTEITQRRQALRGTVPIKNE
jgi:hypothetical protein